MQTDHASDPHLVVEVAVFEARFVSAKEILAVGGDEAESDLPMQAFHTMPKARIHRLVF